jgi:hypothetical protein
VDIIYIKKDLYEKHADLVLEKGLEVYQNCMKQKLRSVLIAEIVRFVTAQETAHRVLYHEDIDLTEQSCQSRRRAA